MPEIIHIGHGLCVVDAEYLKDLQIAVAQKGKRVEFFNKYKTQKTAELQDRIGGKPARVIQLRNEGKVT